MHRGKQGAFTLQFDERGQLRDFTLNTNTAEVILASPGDFGIDTTFPDILEGVLNDSIHP